MRKIKHLSCHWGSLSQSTLRTLESSLWYIHTALSTDSIGFFSPPQFGIFLKYVIFLQKLVAKIFVHPLAVLIFDNLSSKPLPTAAISPPNLHPAAITPTSFPTPHKPLYASAMSVYFCFIYPHPLKTENFSEFICSPLCTASPTLALPLWSASPIPLPFIPSALQDRSFL